MSRTRFGESFLMPVVTGENYFLYICPGVFLNQNFTDMEGSREYYQVDKLYIDQLFAKAKQDYTDTIDDYSLGRVATLTDVIKAAEIVEL